MVCIFFWTLNKMGLLMKQLSDFFQKKLNDN